METRTAAAYIRVSTDDQIEFSPDSQLEALHNYAKKNGLYLPDEFIYMDEGLSGKTTKRPAFKKMIATAKTKPKPFDVILVWKFSRFARNREDSVVYKSMLRKQLNIDVVSISENLGDDKMSILFEAMIEAMDEYYSINLAEEVKRGMTEKARRGGVMSIASFGYKVENGEYVIVEEEAEIIRKAFRDYLNNRGYGGIARDLNNLGIKTHRGNPIENRTVEYWLHNPVYIGKTRWNPNGRTRRDYNATDLIITDSNHEPIIDTELWNSVQEKMAMEKAKYRRYRSIDRKKDLSHWLVGIARCSRCGATLCNASGDLICRNYGRGSCSGIGSITTGKLSKILRNTLTSVFKYGKSVQVEIDEIKPIDKTNDEENSFLNRQLAQLELRLSRVKTAYESGVDTIEEYRENKKNILNEIESVKSIIEEKNKSYTSKEKEIDRGEVKRLVEILDDETISNQEKNKVLGMVVKEIIIDREAPKQPKHIKIVFWNS